VVYARNFVRGPNGERIFAEFGADGSVLQEYGEEMTLRILLIKSVIEKN
jgi:hypothetical protein